MRERFRPPIFVVPLTGLEPVWYLYRGILSPLRLPIPPQRHMKFISSARWRPAAAASAAASATAPRKACRTPLSPPCYEKSIAEDDAFRMEAPPGFEPGSQGFADLCLTTWLWRQTKTVRKVRLERETRLEPATFTLAR